MDFLVLKNCVINVRYVATCGDGCCCWDEYDTFDLSSGDTVSFGGLWHGRRDILNLFWDTSDGQECQMTVADSEIDEMVIGGFFQRI